MKFPLVGNYGVKNVVENAINTGKLPHAIIIEGESGQGKSKLAEYLISAAVCNGNEKPCGECKGCHLADAGTHPDIIRVAPEDKKKNISVEQIRKLREEAYIRPQLSPTKVFLIDKADTMNENSQNALLKILEEPPGNALFLLLTESKNALLDTTNSRCILFSLSSPDKKDAEEYLVKTSGAEKEKAEEILLKSGGNIGKALDILSGKVKDSDGIAEKYFDLIYNGSIYDMTALTFPLEKDRLAADKFFSSFKYTVLSRIRGDSPSASFKEELIRMYDVTVSLENRLKQNANLSLIFTWAAKKYKNCI